MSTPDDRHLLALGFVMMAIEEDATCLEIPTGENAAPVAFALAEMLVSMLSLTGERDPVATLHRWQREHVQRLIDRDAHDREDSA